MATTTLSDAQIALERDKEEQQTSNEDPHSPVDSKGFKDAEIEEPDETEPVVTLKTWLVCIVRRMNLCRRNHGYAD